MSREKRSNLAIFTLAGSILISSVVVSMNQVNAHSTSATKREFLALKQCISNFQKDIAEVWEWHLEEREYNQRTASFIRYYNGEKPKFAEYLGEEYFEDENFSAFSLEPISLYPWIADGLEC
jgi:hypothetical protein